jgi:hypothetical protein
MKLDFEDCENHSRLSGTASLYRNLWDIDDVQSKVVGFI